jgi:hypothetical protein
MNISEVTEKIKAIPLLKDLVLSKPGKDSQHGIITVPTRHFISKKNGRKDELKLSGMYSLFVAHMYRDYKEMDEFFYLTFYHKGEQRDYRRRSFYGIEYNKIFASGNSVDELMTDFECKLIGYELK